MVQYNSLQSERVAFVHVTTTPFVHLYMRFPNRADTRQYVSIPVRRILNEMKDAHIPHNDEMQIVTKLASGISTFKIKFCKIDEKCLNELRERSHRARL